MLNRVLIGFFVKKIRNLVLMIYSSGLMVLVLFENVWMRI